jgi:hypothetical protein
LLSLFKDNKTERFIKCSSLKIVSPLFTQEGFDAILFEPAKKPSQGFLEGEIKNVR